MTTDALGPCPPDGFTTTRACTQDRIPDVPVVSARYADYWRRRAERAEALLKVVTPRMDRHDYACSSEHGLYRKRCDCGLLDLRARVAAHFDSISSKGDDK